MNEFERRALQVAQNHMDLASVVNALGGATVEHFSYTLEFSDFANGSLQSAPFVYSQSIAMQADAWFVCHYISGCVILDATPWYCTDDGDIQIQITDVGRGHVLYSLPSSAGVLASTVSRPQTGIPLLLPTPLLLPPNTNVKVDISLQTATLTDAFFVTFAGSRISAS